MKSVRLVITLIIISLTISFCAEKNEKKVIASTVGQKLKKGKDTTVAACCSSGIPPRFPIRNANVSQPEAGR